MALVGRFFNSNNGDRIYNASDFAAVFGSLVRNGIFPVPANSFKVTANGGTNLRVAVGKAWINGYYADNTTAATLTVNVASTLPRIDLVALRLNLSTRDIRFVVRAGVPAANPVPAEIVRSTAYHELGLAHIRVDPSTTVLTNSAITDLRPDPNYCGIVRGMLENLEGNELFTQLQARFDEWFATIQGQINDNAAASFQSQITNLQNTKLDANQIASPTTQGILLSQDYVRFVNASNLVNNQLRDYNPSNPVTYITLGLQNGVQAYSAVQTPIVRKVGKFVELMGAVTNINTTGTVIANLPEAYRPSRPLFFTGITSTQGGRARLVRWYITSNGELRFEGTSDGSVNVGSNTLFAFHIIFDTDAEF